jgi:F420-0:gamma-glutamyl ligase
MFEIMKAAVCGMYAGMDIGAGWTESAIPVKVDLVPDNGYEALKESITKRIGKCELETGDILVICSKIYAIAQGRIVEKTLIPDRDLHALTKEELGKIAVKISRKTGMPVSHADILCSDSSNVKKGFYTLLPENPNGIALDAAKSIEKAYDTAVDVVISDTDNGFYQGLTMIGCPTIGGTPIGATRGVSLNVCMRVSVAAETKRGKNFGVPLVIIKLSSRLRSRRFIGKYRGYAGRLDYSREGILSERLG